MNSDERLFLRCYTIMPQHSTVGRMISPEPAFPDWSLARAFATPILAHVSRNIAWSEAAGKMLAHRIYIVYYPLTDFLPFIIEKICWVSDSGHRRNIRHVQGEPRGIGHRIGCAKLRRCAPRK